MDAGRGSLMHSLRAAKHESNSFLKNGPLDEREGSGACLELANTPRLRRPEAEAWIPVAVDSGDVILRPRSTRLFAFIDCAARRHWAAFTMESESSGDYRHPGAVHKLLQPCSWQACLRCSSESDSGIDVPRPPEQQGRF